MLAAVEANAARCIGTVLRYPDELYTHSFQRETTAAQLDFPVRWTALISQRCAAWGEHSYVQRGTVQRAARV